MPRRVPQPNQAVPSDEELIRQWHRVGDSAAEVICKIIDYSKLDGKASPTERRAGSSNVRGALCSLIDEVIVLVTLD